jgi:hypothetical protein
LKKNPFNSTTPTSVNLVCHFGEASMGTDPRSA